MLEFKEKEKIERYCFGEGHRKAVIEFVNDKFAQCDYACLPKYYTIDDWKFMHALSAKIMEMCDA